MSADDPFDLNRFLIAQDRVMDDVRAELRAGRKRSHWMWFVFPQLAGLGISPTAQFYGLASLDEAKAYLAHPILGARLRDCAALVLAQQGRSLLEIFGDPDRLKFRSCMTLFEASAPDDSLFSAALDQFCGGERDPATLRLLSSPNE
jgi:uncharacterized protein (DUF1810 family)